MWTDDQRRLAIEALGRISSEAAIDCLVGYAAGCSTTILTALTGVWHFFNDRRSYAREVLTRALQGHESWTPAALRSIDGIEEISAVEGLRALDLHFCTLSDIRPVATLTQLECIDLSNTRVTDISPLTELHRLREIKIRFTSVENIGCLVKCPELRSVDITGTEPYGVAELRAARPDIEVIGVDYVGRRPKQATRRRR